MEFLKEVLGEELYGQMAAKLKDKDIELVNAKDGSYLPRAKFNEVNDEIKALKGQLKERDAQLSKLATDGQTTEELKAKITELQTANSETAKAHEAQLAKIQKDYAIKDALKDAKNPATVMPLLNMDEIKLDKDGKLVGIEAQLETIKKENGYLFNTPGQPGSPGANPAGGAAGTIAGEYMDKYQAAVKTGDTVTAIKVKQEAFSKGIEL